MLSPQGDNLDTLLFQIVVPEEMIPPVQDGLVSAFKGDIPQIKEVIVIV